MESIYLLGNAGSENQKFIRAISQEAQNKFEFDEQFKKRFTARIKFRGKKVEVENYLILLRNRNICRYYDSETIEAIKERKSLAEVCPDGS